MFISSHILLACFMACAFLLKKCGMALRERLPYESHTSTTHDPLVSRMATNSLAVVYGLREVCIDVIHDAVIL